jgi:hypothetical protein
MKITAFTQNAAVTADPVVALWNKFQKARAAVEIIGERDEDFWRSMSEQEKVAYMKLYPDFDPSLPVGYCSIEHQRAEQYEDAIREKFHMTVATSPEGIMLQVEYALAELWDDEILAALKSSINKGLKNLQPDFATAIAA